METKPLKSFSSCEFRPKNIPCVQVEPICQTKEIDNDKMSTNTLMSSENRWPHILAVQIKRRRKGRRLSVIRHLNFEWHQNPAKAGNEDRKSDWWRRMTTLVTLRVTERNTSRCSYQCGNSRGVHWRVSRRHQHRLQNNRRERVTVRSMQVGTGE